jgi:hypothetical protein
MTALDETRRRVWSVARQLGSVKVRRAALASLKPGDLVHAVDPETHAIMGTRALTLVDRRRETATVVFGRPAAQLFDFWPLRYIAELEGRKAWLFSDDGQEVEPWVELKPHGLLLVRAWPPEET